MNKEPDSLRFIFKRKEWTFRYGLISNMYRIVYSDTEL